MQGSFIRPWRLLNDINRLNARVLLARTGSRIVGILAYHDGSAAQGTDIGDRKDFAEGLWFFVDPAFQRSGVGSELYRAALERGRKEGYKHAYGYTALPAHGFYEKLGFVHVPEYDSYPAEGFYNAGINKRLQEICSHGDYTKLQKTPISLFFEKREI
jgi:GNAT superfamily N-acetyltransferase